MNEQGGKKGATNIPFPAHIFNISDKLLAEILNSPHSLPHAKSGSITWSGTQKLN